MRSLQRYDGKNFIEVEVPYEFQNGDNNTELFYLTTINRRRQNKVLQLQNCWGEWISNKTEILQNCGKFFENMLTSSGLRVDDDAYQGFLRWLL